MIQFNHYTIRLLTENDLQAYYSLIDHNRPRLEDFFAGTVAITKTLEDTEIHLRDVIAKCAERKHYPFVVVDDTNGALIASIQIKGLDWTIPKGEIGYYIDAGYEGKGVITQAVSKIIAYGFEELGLSKIFIRTHESNISSRKVAEKNGMIYEGTIRRDYKMTSGVIIDTMYYGILQEEYQQLNNSNRELC